MLHGLSKHIVHCYFRAAECRELAERCVSAADRQFYLEREQAWLSLARSHQVSETIANMLRELDTQRRRTWPPPRISSPRQTLPQCPACRIQMRLYAWEPPLLVPVEDAFLLCPNCGRLGNNADALICRPCDI